MPYEVRPLAVDEWWSLRIVRQEALKESPQAFLSNPDDVAQWSDEDWINTFADTLWLVARHEADVVGIVGSVPEDGDPAIRHVHSAWVAPPHRRNGVFSVLLRLLIDLETGAGAEELLLWVFEDNEDAYRAYLQMGFTETGKRQKPKGSDRYERQLRLAIR